MDYFFFSFSLYKSCVCRVRLSTRRRCRDVIKLAALLFDTEHKDPVAFARMETHAEGGAGRKEVLIGRDARGRVTTDPPPPPPPI